jgi:hypothetical protein
MPECCSIHFTGWYCPKCGLPISFADHGGSTPISIGNISTKNVTINQQLVQGDLIQAGGIKSTGRGNEVPESFALPPPPPPFEEDDLPLPPPPAEDDLPLPPPPPPFEEDDLPLPPLPAVEELPLSPPPLPSLEEEPESTVKIVDKSEGILPPNDAEIITDELGVEWFEENGKWFYKNPEDDWELFQT